jgi:hypothetical protein
MKTIRTLQFTDLLLGIGSARLAYTGYLCAVLIFGI